MEKIRKAERAADQTAALMLPGIRQLIETVDQVLTRHDRETVTVPCGKTEESERVARPAATV